jgi:hypothetical protein
MSVRAAAARHLQGTPVALPAALDRCSEHWWRLPPRARAALVLLALIAFVAAGEKRVAAVRDQWGGPPRPALVATGHIAVGQAPQVRAVRLPPALVPDDAPQQVPADARLALALPKGAVLTRAHLSPRGPAAGLAHDLRVVPVPVDPGWDVRAGGWVDVWALSSSAGSTRVAEHRPVLAVLSDDDPPSALVGLAPTEVAAAMRGFADGEVLLTHAPP